jgi:hypothetical protein
MKHRANKSMLNLKERDHRDLFRYNKTASNSNKDKRNFEVHFMAVLFEIIVLTLNIYPSVVKKS